VWRFALVPSLNDENPVLGCGQGYSKHQPMWLYVLLKIVVYYDYNYFISGTSFFIQEIGISQMTFFIPEMTCQFRPCLVVHIYNYKTKGV